MGTINVGLRQGDAIDPFHLENGFEAVIGYECLWSVYFAVTLASPGPGKRFREMAAAHVGSHG